MTDGGFRTAVDGETVVVRLPDPRHAASEVRVWSDLELAETRLQPVDEGWELSIDDLPVDRFEYLFVVDGEHRLDPTHDRTVDGAFGEHSWLVLPGYRSPHWLEEPRVDGDLTELSLGGIDLVVWEPPGAEHLLVAHDGPEMAAYGGLLDFVATGIEAGRIPPTRVALLEPGERNKRYSADPEYAAALTGEVVPALLAAAPTRTDPVLCGQSLGGVATLHAAWTTPGMFAGLLLQSGSFFTPELDPQEASFDYWDEVTGFVASVHSATRAVPDAPVIAMTCGSAEENLANNRALREHLASTGVEVSWAETRQGHTWTCWRDLLDPALTDLLRRVWR